MRLCFIMLRSVTVTVVLFVPSSDLDAGRRIEEQHIVSAAMAEVEHVLDRAGRGVDRTAAQTTTVKPVVFDEAHDGSLRDALVADVVLLGEGRDHDEGHAGARTAAAVYRLALQAIRCACRCRTCRGR